MDKQRKCIRCGVVPDSFVGFERCRCHNCGLCFYDVATLIAPALRSVLEAAPEWPSGSLPWAMLEESYREWYHGQRKAAMEE